MNWALIRKHGPTVFGLILLVTAGEWSKAHRGKWADAIERIAFPQNF